MEKYIKHILKKIHDREMREFIKHHIKHISFNKEKIEAVVLVDKQYAIGKLQSAHIFRHFCDAIHECFGPEVAINLQLQNPHHAHEREMMIPHNIHY